MTDSELLEFIASQVGNLTTKVDGISNQVDNLSNQVDTITKEVAGIKKTVTKIEHEHGEKLSALFDGYKQNTEKLNHIEKEVSNHEEIILRRVR